MPIVDKTIDDLPEAPRITPPDAFVLQQDGTAKKLTGQTLIRDLLALLDGHGGIQKVELTGSNGLVDTYTIAYSDGSTSTFQLKNGDPGVYLGVGPVPETASIWLDETTSPPTLKVRDGNWNWSSVPVVAQSPTEGDFKTWNLAVNWPIGRLWWSLDPTDPHDIVGGTWEAVQDTFIIAAGPDHPAGTSGGAFEITPSEDQLPSHDHDPSPYRETWIVKDSMPRREIALNSGSKVYALTADSLDSWEVGRTGKTGKGNPIDITNKNVAYYCWRRIS